jgi:integrase
MARKKAKRYFGNVRQLKSGRYQARYTGPDGRSYSARRPDGGPLTFDTQGDAEAWLSIRHSEILRGAWLPPKADEGPKAKPITVREYADAWLVERDLEATTRELYRQLLDDHILPAFGGKPVADVKPAAVRAWYATLCRADEAKGLKDRPTARAHTYSLLRTIMNTAISDELVAANPCRIRGAGQTKRAKKIQPATLAELEALVKAIPARYRLMVLLASWCALRFGELAEIRRSDVDVKNGIVRVRRSVSNTKGRRNVKEPKSEAGKRPVNIPPHLLPTVKAHLRDHVLVAREALLFPSAGDPNRHMAGSTLSKVYLPARDAAGRPDLRFHDLRHTGAVLAAATGATLAELMARLGHSTPGAAMRYQHASQDRDKAIAAALSDLAKGKVIPIDVARKEATGE